MSDSGALPVQSYPLGYEPASRGARGEGALGHWVVRVPGGPAFALSAIQACAFAARGLPTGSSTRDVLERISRAFVEASPE